MLNIFRSQLAKTNPKRLVINLAAIATLLVIISAIIAIAKRAIGKYTKIGKLEELLVSTDVYSRICIWNGKNSRKIANIVTNYSIFAVSLSHDGNYIALANEDNIEIRSVTQKAPIQTCSGCEFAADLTFSPDGKWIASARKDDAVRIWDTTSGQLVRELKRKNTCFTTVAFSPDGEIASADAKGTLIFWDSHRGNITFSSCAHESIVTTLSFSPDGKYLASGSCDTKICLWDGQERIYLTGHEKPVSSVAFASEGKLLASGSDDKTVRIWNIDKRQIVQILEGYTENVYSVAFYPDDNFLASVGEDNKIRIWNLNTGRVVRILRDQVRLLGIRSIKPYS